MRPEVFGFFLEHLHQMHKTASGNDELDGGRTVLSDSDMGFIQQARANKKGKLKDKDIEYLAHSLKLTPESIVEFIEMVETEE